MKKRWFCFLGLCATLLWGTTGCGTFMARRMIQAPNTYPTWFAPEAPVLLGFPTNLFQNFPKQFVDVGPPDAQLCYRIIEPADYHFAVTSTNWTEDGLKRTDFEFHAEIPARTNQRTTHPKGTILLIHGYALAQFSMMPWALRLAEDGWRCVLLDLRGHGKSTGDKIYYGLQEPHDLTQLLDKLTSTGQLQQPVAAFGESYGAVMAMRLKAEDPRVQTVVAITPYAGLSNAVMNLRYEYASWVPKTLTRAGLKKLPKLLNTSACELDTTTVLSQHPESVLLIAADDDKIAPLSEVKELRQLASSDSKLIVVPNSTHETVTYHFEDLTAPVLAWLSEKTN